jgi:uncharacterized membrane protein SpoIIM required for sporulation
MLRETAFLKINAAKWKSFDALVKKGDHINPDELVRLYVEVTDDLSYANTYYPASETSHYLNHLALKVHQQVYKNKKEEKGRFARFWKTELPLHFFHFRKELGLSFVLFLMGILIGALSSAYDEGFVRLILGDQYVNMTLANIEKGDPMGVYKSADEGFMFLRITANNIRVSFIVFVSGLFLSVGTGMVLLSNGIMLGAFQYFFYQKGLFLTSFLSIWIHGTLEISAIIIAGSAGFALGNGILFPGTYSRLDSFQKGAKNGLKIVIGLVPIFVVAGFLESFVTRLTEFHWVIKAGIIGSSLLFILFYFFYYPFHLNNQSHGKNYITSIP